MIVLTTFVTGLVIWITAWALGIKAFDAFLFTAFITAVAAAVQLAKPFVMRFVKGTPVTPGER